MECFHALLGCYMAETVCWNQCEHYCRWSIAENQLPCGRLFRRCRDYVSNCSLPVWS